MILAVLIGGFVGYFANAQTIVAQVSSNKAAVDQELLAVRDDLRALCFVVHKGDSPETRCGEIPTGASQKHVYKECWKSGWSGRGKVVCKYAMDAPAIGGENQLNPGFQDSPGGRRRIEAEEEDFGLGMGSGLGDDEPETVHTPIRASGNTFFELENESNELQSMALEDDKGGKYMLSNSVCMLMGTTMHETHDHDVNPQCVIKPNEQGIWELTHVSATCNVFCKQTSSRMF